MEHTKTFKIKLQIVSSFFLGICVTAISCGQQRHSNSNNPDSSADSIESGLVDEQNNRLMSLLEKDLIVEQVKDSLLSVAEQVVNSKASVTQTAEEVNIMSFGAKGDGISDDSESLIKAINYIQQNTFSDFNLVIPEGRQFAIRAEIKASGVNITGGGTIVPVNGKIDYTLILMGDNNSIKGVDFFEKSRVRNLLTIDGNNNIISDCKFDGPSRSSSSNVVYSDRMLFLADNESNGNIIQRCTINNGRIGVGLSGSYKFLDSEVSNCIMGIWARASSRDSEIARNVIRDNNVNNESGADGILAHRNVSNLHIHHNKIYNSGEHGIYFQGDNSIIEFNEVYNNHGSGIKLASYTTSLYGYPDGRAASYIGHKVTVRNNTCYNNSIAKNSSTGAGIYLQAPLKEIIISDNKCYENYYGIRSASVSRISAEELDTKAVLKEITFAGNNVVDNKKESLFIEGETGIVIKNNIADDILTTAKTSTHRLRNPIISGNEVSGKLHLNRVEGGVIENNTINNLNFNSNSIKSNYKLLNNKIQTTNRQ